MAASKPLLPPLAPARSIACSKVLVVSTPNATGTPVSAATHPLEPLAAGEIRRAFTIVQAHFAAPANGLPATGLFFPALWLEEPAKAVVQAWQPGQAFPGVQSQGELFAPALGQTTSELQLIGVRDARRRVPVVDQLAGQARSELAG